MQEGYDALTQKLWVNIKGLTLFEYELVFPFQHYCASNQVDHLVFYSAEIDSYQD